METLTISLPKVKVTRYSISIPKKLVLKIAKIFTLFLIFAGTFIWLFV